MTRSRHINAPKRTWSAAELALLQAQYASTRTVDIAAALGIKIELVYRKASSLRLRKSPAFAASDKSGRIFKGGKLGQLTQFAPGQKPWNAGTHYVAGGRSAETRFKPGRKPEDSRNYLPIGSLRISADGYLERKTTDDPSIYPARRWVAVARLVWEAAHGPIPPGHVIVFKPGRKSAELAHITPDALECISRRELVHRNSIWSHGKDLGKLYQLKGAITRQANRIKSERAAS